MRTISASNATQPLWTSRPRLCRLGVEELELRIVPAVPRPDHVVMVIEENHDFTQIVGSSAAPYINSLVQQGALMTNSTAIEHPSQPNYLDLFSGANQGVSDDSRPAGLPFSTPNLGAQLRTAGLSFTGYSDSLPSIGFDGDHFTSTAGQTQYERKHNPWANWVNNPVGANQLPASVNQPFTSFPTDFTQLPTLSIVVPNQQNDMHDGSIQQGDKWLKDNLDGYVQWAKSNNSLLIVTWDENDSSPGNHISTIFVGAMVKPGFTDNQPINHFSVLRTIEEMYGLPTAGASAGATAISNIWGLTPPTTVGTPNQRYVASVYLALLKRPVDLDGLNYWSGLLDGGVDRSIIAALLTHSAEYYKTNVIIPAYRQFLGRDADQAGLDYWTVLLQGGLTDEQMQAGFIAAPEFYNNANGGAVPISPAHDRAWVDALYVSLFGRGPDQVGSDFWTGALQGFLSRVQVANNFTASTEGLSVRIQQTYQRYLGRAADPFGLAYWLTRYQFGATDEDIVTGFIGSDEFFRQATN